MCLLLQLLYIYPSAINQHIDEFATVLLHPGGDKEVKQLFYANLHALMMGRLGPKHARVDVLCHYCDSDELCAFCFTWCN